MYEVLYPLLAKKLITAAAIVIPYKYPAVGPVKYTIPPPVAKTGKPIAPSNK